MSIACFSLLAKPIRTNSPFRFHPTSSAVAADRGVDAQSVTVAYLAQLKENLDKSVAEAKISRKQADYALEQAGERVMGQLEKIWADGFRGFPGRGRPDQMKGFSRSERCLAIRGSFWGQIRRRDVVDSRS